MTEMKEVTVFTNGDSTKPSTWSNVPYCFTETLTAKGITVNRVDLSQNKKIKKIFNKTIKRLITLINEKSTYDYYRSIFHFMDVRQRIKKSEQQYPNSDANIFLTFSFSSSGVTRKPSIQFCDWTYEHHIEHFLERQPDFFEKKCVDRERKQIENSDYVFSLFPFATEKMKEKINNKNILYIGNVINTTHETPDASDIKEKKSSKSIVFIGGKKYKEGASALIQAFSKIKEKHPDLVLNIIGMKESDFKTVPADVYCHGYLDKGNDSERMLYYKLLKDAKLIINTTPKWGAFSATIEAMSFYTPVISSPYEDFVRTFGENISFGYYCAQNTPESIEETLLSLINHPEYESLCINAHQSVEQFTWSAYIDKLIKIVESNPREKNSN